MDRKIRASARTGRHEEGDRVSLHLFVALIFSLLQIVPLPFDFAWIAIILCGVPIILHAVIGLITAFDIKADVLYPWR